MSALRRLARRLRVLLHRHDRIECWCELPTAADLLPKVTGPVQCADCWALPGRVHELSCPEVSWPQMKAYLDRIGGAR